MRINFSRFLFAQSKTIGFSTVLLAFSYGASRVLGVVRDRLLVGSLPADQADVYFAAFRVPDLLYALFVLGGISAVFLPLFSQEMEKGKDEAWNFASRLLHILLLLAGACSIALFFLMPWLVAFVAPGFSEMQQGQLAMLSRVLLLSPILFGVSSIFSGVLQYFNKFFFYALAPIFYNVGIIVGILFLLPRWGLAGLGVGVVAGVALHILVQMPSAFRAGFSWKPKFGMDQTTWKAVRLALPRTLGTGVYQINLVAMTAFASLISTGSITIFSVADSLQQVPASLIGVSVALAVFPLLSKVAAQGDKEKFIQMTLSSFRKIILFTLPSAAVILLLRELIVRVLYQSGEFSADDVVLTGAALGVFSFGIIFQSLIPLLTRAFFALQDTKTPTWIGGACVILNIGLAFLLVRFFSSLAVAQAGGNILQSREAVVIALPLALVVSGGVQAMLLAILLKRRLRNWRKSGR